MNKVPKSGNYIYIIKPTDSTLPDGKLLTRQPTLDMLQSGVGGHIELVPRFNKLYNRDCIALCNEEGKLQNPPLPLNLFAHYLWEQAVGRIIREDSLVGNIVVIVGDPDFLGEL